jgi:hypothetical protein
MDLKEVTDNKIRCLDGEKKGKGRREGRGESIKKETTAMEGEGLLSGPDRLIHQLRTRCDWR